MENILPISGMNYKLFLVEHEDTDRERVLSAETAGISLERDVEHEEVWSAHEGNVIFRYPVEESVTLTIKLRRRDDGSFFRFEEPALMEGEEID